MNRSLVTAGVVVRRRRGGGIDGGKEQGAMARVGLLVTKLEKRMQGCRGLRGMVCLAKT